MQLEACSLQLLLIHVINKEEQDNDQGKNAQGHSYRVAVKNVEHKKLVV
jgi:hypothetical protein